MESPPPPATPAAATSSPSPADQARIRRERRQAKIKAQGTSRLNQITRTQSGSKLYEDEPLAAAAAAVVPETVVVEVKGTFGLLAGG